MANGFSNTFVLLSVAVCIILVVTTSAVTVHVQQTTTARMLHYGLTRSLQAIAMHNLTNITEEFNVIENNTEVIKELCRIVAYYYLVEAVDDGSIIHSKLEQNAHDVLTYWSTTYCSGCNVTLTEFGQKCERTALHPLMSIPAPFWW